MRVGGGGLGDLLRAGTAVRGGKALETGETGLVMSMMTLPCKYVPVLTHHRRLADPGHGEDNDLPGRVTR
ncbi:hypothetical protein [Streptomyces sp. MBT53]|uniref:hypothetical protein n=1 Tax=Streptomyces sp. MBT53 TaxID=1488384 RepID=UPI0019116D0D|nr:hypothetical protein [Streptomyces sp. MBT53]